jgi:hypothetical protein
VAARRWTSAFANCPPQTYSADGDPVGPEPTAHGVREERPFRKLTDKPLHEGLGKIIPELRGAVRPTGEPWWPKLRQIQTLAALNSDFGNWSARRAPIQPGDTNSSSVRSLNERRREMSRSPHGVLAALLILHT